MHASGSEEEYIEKAIAEGVKILGFSDHAPFPYPNGYVSTYKMTLDEAEDYYKTLSFLREKYKDKIQIYIGYESEYYEDLWDAALREWRKFPPEYLILGQHFVGTEYDRTRATYVYASCGRNELLPEYVDTVVKGIKTGKFTYVAHPDIFTYGGSLGEYERQMSRLIEAAISEDVPLEINLLGISEGRMYPRLDFWRLAGSYGAKVVVGCDAHEPRRVAVPTEIGRAMDIVSKYNLKLSETLELRNPFL